MKIAGFKKQSFIDYPGYITAVVFTQGCNFRCGYCHNPSLVLPELFEETYSNEEVLSYIHKYNKLLDAVCITGGEPTLHADLPDFIRQIKHEGLKIKLDTNGSNPDMLQQLYQEQLLDFVAMDIKHLLQLEKYRSIVGKKMSSHLFDKVLKSITLIEQSGIGYQFRTTVVKGYHSDTDIEILKNRFKKHYKTQAFNPEVVLDEINFKEEKYTKEAS